MQHIMQTAEARRHSGTTGHEVTPVLAGPPHARQFRIDCSHAHPVTLDAAVLRDKRILTGNEPGSFTESYLLPRTQILYRFRENGWNSHAISSPRAGAGKTLTANNLAISMTRMIGSCPSALSVPSPTPAWR